MMKIKSMMIAVLAICMEHCLSVTVWLTIMFTIRTPQNMSRRWYRLTKTSASWSIPTAITASLVVTPATTCSDRPSITSTLS